MLCCQSVIAQTVVSMLCTDACSCSVLGGLYACSTLASITRTANAILQSNVTEDAGGSVQATTACTGGHLDDKPLCCHINATADSCASICIIRPTTATQQRYDTDQHVCEQVRCSLAPQQVCQHCQHCITMQSAHRQVQLWCQRLAC
jgi:hypothetical protein